VAWAKKEIVWLMVNCGPPLSAVKVWPARSNSTVMTLPRGLPPGLSKLSGYRATAVTSESGKRLV
jgi:hypothetical protein